MASRRLASGKSCGGSTEPQPTKSRRLPSTSITPHPVRRRPGSMPRIRTDERIGWEDMGIYTQDSRLVSPVLTFVPYRGGHSYECQSQKDTSNHIIPVWL